MALNLTINVNCPLWADFNGTMVSRGLENISDTFYVKVIEVNGTKELCMCIASFKSDSVEYHQKFGFSPDLDGENFIRQAYLHLKTLPEFADAEDC